MQINSHFIQHEIENFFFLMLSSFPEYLREAKKVHPLSEF